MKPTEDAKKQGEKLETSHERPSGRPPPADPNKDGKTTPPIFRTLTTRTFRTTMSRAAATSDPVGADNQGGL